MDSQERDEIASIATETDQRQHMKSQEDEEFERALQAYTLKKKMYDHQMQYRYGLLSLIGCLLTTAMGMVV